VRFGNRISYFRPQEKKSCKGVKGRGKARTRRAEGRRLTMPTLRWGITVGGEVGVKTRDKFRISARPYED